MAVAVEHMADEWLSRPPSSSVSDGRYRLPLGSALPDLPVSVAYGPGVQIWHLATLPLRLPLSVLIEPDEDAFIARCPDVPQLYGYGETQEDAVESLKREIESLWEDLHEEAQFSDEYIGVRNFLERCISD